MEKQSGCQPFWRSVNITTSCAEVWTLKVRPPLQAQEPRAMDERNTRSSKGCWVMVWPLLLLPRNCEMYEFHFSWTRSVTNHLLNALCASMLHYTQWKYKLCQHFGMTLVIFSITNVKTFPLSKKLLLNMQPVRYFTYLTIDTLSAFRRGMDAHSLL